MNTKERLLNRMKCVEKLAIVNATPGALEQMAGEQYRTELLFFGSPVEEHVAIMQTVQEHLRTESRQAGERPGFPQTIWPQ